MNWLHYLLEANLYLTVFYALYFLFIRNDTHYALSRVYLLVTSVISFVIPLLQLGFLKPVEPQIISVTLIPPPPPAINSNSVPIETISFSWQDGLVAAYLVGSALLLIVFSIKIYQLFKLTRAVNTQVDPAYKLIYIDDSNTAFSFFNFLFIGTKADGADTIIQHELVHIRQKHSIDIIFMEFLKIVNWFNPFIYLLQASLKTLHEYIADEQTATNDVINYSTFLVNNAYGLSGSSITHSFFNYNLLKKRIIMLNQQRSGNLARLKYLLAIPIIVGLLCVSTLAFSKSYGIVDLFPQKTDTPKKPRYDVWNKSYDHTFTTSKGYKVRERIIFVSGAVSKTAEIIDKDGQKHLYDDRWISSKECKFVKEEYGYQFPRDTVINVKLLPPPPVPTTPIKTILFPRPKHPAELTSKGYNYAESAYLINGKTDFRVIIVEKDGSQKDFFKSKATPEEIKLLRDKYGYTFPVMNIYTKMPPPPPAPAKAEIDKRPPPPPPAPPVKNTKALIYVPKGANSHAYSAVLVVNSKLYNLKDPLKKFTDTPGRTQAMETGVAIYDKP